MKMSDVFALPVYSGTQEVTIHNKEKPCIVSGTNTVLVARKKYIDSAIQAINNHDRLTEENEKLREALSDVIDGESKYDLANMTGHSLERCEEIIKLLEQTSD